MKSRIYRIGPLNQETYRRIVSGQNQGFGARVLRLLLRGVALIYGLAVRLRNLGYRWGILRSHAAGVPVISIGNITAGGTGKTPLVIWLCNYLQNKGIRCSILTRGYKTQSGDISDEPALLAKSCEGTSVVINPNRLAGAHKAVSVHQAQAIVMDDGFQHRKLWRDLDIVAVDATCPFGYGRILPAGLLREPISGLARASAVVITRADQVSGEALDAIEQHTRRYVPTIPIAKTVHKLSHAVSYPNQVIGLEELRSRKVYAFCGIGNPQAFFDSLKRNTIALCGTKTFDDHHAYTRADVEQIFTEAAACGATVILCTQKDWIKNALLAPSREGIVFAYLAMELDFLEGVDKITGLMDSLLDTTNGKCSV
ncbi:MAG: tetraacyldisaccharide 4'-kinase [Phycisphaerae bacterium]|nr:tetraacyldisaccharide 4'-kinase [Phycisphaerae bacterium]